jgi:hypothetical protein
MKAAHLQYLQYLEVDHDLADAENHDCTDGLRSTLDLEADKNDRVWCELGIGYPNLQPILPVLKNNHLFIKSDICYVTCFVL